MDPPTQDPKQAGQFDVAGCVCASAFYILFWIALFIVWAVVLKIIQNPGPLRFI
jgi:hypothetical protein